jgi:hypothetical protein
VKVRVVGTRNQPGRCAYCHDQLVALGHRCGSCATWLHLDCWEEVETCVTPGCEEKAPQRARRGQGTGRKSVRSRPSGRTRARDHRDRGRGRAHVRTDEDLEAWAAESAHSRRDYSFWARTAPYARLLLSLVLNLAIVGAVLAVVFWFFSDPSHAWQSLRKGKGGSSSDAHAWMMILFLGGMGVFFGFMAGFWLYKWPGVWVETGRLLSRARPEPLRMQIWKEKSGKHTKTFAKFKTIDGNVRAGMEKVLLEGVLPPFWLRSECVRKPVLVYGLEDGEPPYLIEDVSGQLALIHP